MSSFILDASYARLTSKTSFLVLEIGYDLVGCTMRKDVALALLGLSNPEPSESQINEAYYAAVQLNHPDKYVNNEKLRQHAEEQCKLINEAREVLLQDARKRSSHSTFEHRSSTNSGQQTDHHRQASSAETKADQSPNTGSAYYSVTPVLDIWHTELLASIAGALVSLVIFNLSNLIGFTGDLVRFVFMVFQFIYAIAVYPSFFGLKPKIQSSPAIAFWNCAVGSFIFGPLWNSNLTNKHKGISHIVFAILDGLIFAYWVFLFGWMFSLLNSF